MEHLNYHHLRYFFETAQHGSMSAAARVLRVTQPTVSAQIRELEEQCGGPLIEREGNRWILTALGQHVHTYAADIFALGAELQSSLRESSAVEAPLRVGVVEALPKLVVYSLLEPAIGDGVALKVEVADMGTLAERLVLHHLDLVLSDYPLAPHQAPSVHNHALGRSAVGVFGVPELCEAHAPMPEGLDGAPFLLLPRTAALRRTLEHRLQREELTVKVAGEFQDSALIKVFASRGYGFMVAPVMMATHLQAAFGLQQAHIWPDATEDLYLLSTERQVEHPAARGILASARDALDALP